MVLIGNKFTKKKIIMIAILCAVAIVILARAVFLIKKHQEELALQIEDINGDSKELAVITDEVIEQWTEDYRTIMRRVFRRGDDPSGVEGKFKDYDYTEIENEIGKLSGIYVCTAYKGKGREVTYTIDSKVLEGNLRIVITNEENDIMYDVPIDSKETVTFVAEENKIYYVKFVGESAKLDITVTRDDGEDT